MKTKLTFEEAMTLPMWIVKRRIRKETMEIIKHSLSDNQQLNEEKA